MPDFNSIPSLGINVVGAVTGEYGLGEATRGTLRSMEAANIGFTVRKVEVGWHRHLDQTYASFISDENPYLVNLVHTNPDEGLYKSLGSEYTILDIGVGNFLNFILLGSTPLITLMKSGLLVTTQPKRYQQFHPFQSSRSCLVFLYPFHHWGGSH